MYGRDDLPEELDRKVALDLHEQGYELTPDDVHGIVHDAFAKIRRGMREKGYELPYSDIDMLRQLRIGFALESFPMTAEEIEQFEKEIEDAEPIEISQEELDRIMEKVLVAIRRDDPKLWMVIGPNGEVIKRFHNQANAEVSCLERNVFAVQRKLSARYYVEFEGGE